MLLKSLRYLLLITFALVVCHIVSVAVTLHNGGSAKYLRGSSSAHDHLVESFSDPAPPTENTHVFNLSHLRRRADGVHPQPDGDFAEISPLPPRDGPSDQGPSTNIESPDTGSVWGGPSSGGGSVHFLRGDRWLGGGNTTIDGRRIGRGDEMIIIFIIICLVIVSIDWEWVRFTLLAWTRANEMVSESEEDLREYAPWLGNLSSSDELRLEREFRITIDTLRSNNPNLEMMNEYLDRMADDANNLDTDRFQEGFTELTGVGAEMQIQRPPDDAEAVRTRRGGRRVRVSKIVRLLRARVLIHFGRPKYTSANLITVQNFLNAQDDITKSVESVALVRIYRRVIPWVFNPSSDEIVDAVAMNQSSWFCCFPNILVRRRQVYDANRPPQ